MFWNAAQGHILLDGAVMDYVTFGRGHEVLLLLPGLGDGLATVRGMALPLAAAYRIYAPYYKVYLFSRKEPLPVAAPHGTWLTTWPEPWSGWTSGRPI